MSGFDFRLGKVLKFRESQEKAAQHKLFALENSLHKNQEELTEMETELKTITSTLWKENIDNKIDISERLFQSRYSDYLTHSIACKAHAVQAKAHEVNSSRGELRTKRINKEILNKLKDKQKESYLRYNSLLEQKQIDEFSTIKYSRDN